MLEMKSQNTPSNSGYKHNIKNAKRRAVSPILATVVLLAITVTGGGLAFALFTGGTTASNAQNQITVENAQGMSGSGHTDVVATLKNSGSLPWTTLEVTVSKSDLSEPMLYESLHENFIGADPSGFDASNPDANEHVDEEVENPLETEWIASLDKSFGTEGVLDEGEGISVGTDFVASQESPEQTTVLIFNGTAAHNLFSTDNSTLGQFRDGTDFSQSELETRTGETMCVLSSGSTWEECTANFLFLDPSMDGEFACQMPEETVECSGWTTKELEEPIGSGSSMYFYADAFNKEVTGLGNVVVQPGDSLVFNLISEDNQGGNQRVQTIGKVSGV